MLAAGLRMEEGGADKRFVWVYCRFEVADWAMRVVLY